MLKLVFYFWIKNKNKLFYNNGDGLCIIFQAAIVKNVSYVVKVMHDRLMDTVIRHILVALKFKHNLTISDGYNYCHKFYK